MHGCLGVGWWVGLVECCAWVLGLVGLVECVIWHIANRVCVLIPYSLSPRLLNEGYAIRGTCFSSMQRTQMGGGSYNRKQRTFPVAEMTVPASCHAHWPSHSFPL